MHQITLFYGIEVPTLIIIFLLSGILQVVLNKILAELKIYEYVWHPGLFRIALFVCIFASFSLLIYK